MSESCCERSFELRKSFRSSEQMCCEQRSLQKELLLAVDCQADHFKQSKCLHHNLYPDQPEAIASDL